MKKPRVIQGPFYFTRQFDQANAPRIMAQLPELHRAAEFTRESIDQEARTIPVVFASESPVQRWFGRERLICTPDACRMDRINTMGPFLSEHERERQIGVIVSGSPSLGADRRARATLRFSKNAPLAEQEWRDVIDEIRGLFSVGYVVHRLVLREEDESRGDLYDAMDWEPLEISLVSVPADVNCIVDGRGAPLQSHPVLVTADTEQSARSLNMHRSNRTSYFSKFMAPDDGSNVPTSPPITEPANTEPVRGPVDDTERNRVRELGAIGARFGCMDQMLDLINSGGTVEAAYRHVAENNLRAMEAPRANPGGGNRPIAPAGSGSGTSAAPVSRSIGEALVASPQYREFAGVAIRNTPNLRSGFDFPVSSFRATLTTANIPAAAAASQMLPGVQMLEQQRLTIADLLAPGQTTSPKIIYTQELSYTNAAAAVAEGALKPEATFALTAAEASVRKIAVTAKISDEMVADYAYVQTYVDSRLRYMVEEREEIQLLNGDGVAPNILGLLNTPGIQTQAKGADSVPDAVHKGITKARVIGRSEPSGIVINPYDWEKIALLKDANGSYVAGGPFYNAQGGAFAPFARIWGLAVVQTTAIAAGTALVGAFRTQAQLFRREGITVETTNSNEDDFKKNLIAIRAEERLAICVYRPAAFVSVTGIV